MSTYTKENAAEDLLRSSQVIIPSGVTLIEDSAFRNCTGLTSVVIPAGVTTIGDFAFSGCNGLTSIVIPEDVTSIGVGAFWHCTGLNSVVIPKGVTSIGDHAFYRCTGLTSVIIPASVTSIGQYAFVRCTGLTSAVIPEGVTSIGKFAFSNCTSLTSLVIPESLTAIDPSVINGCNQLQFVYAPDHLHDNLREFLPRGTQILELDTHCLNQSDAELRLLDENQQVAPPSPRTPEPTAPERISGTKIAVSTLTSASLLGIGITLIKYGALTGLAAPLLWPLAIGLTVLGGIALVGVMGISIRQCYRDHSVFKAKKAMNTDRLQGDLNEIAFKAEENMQQTLFSPPPSESANQHQKITGIPIASLRAAFSAVYH